MSRNSYKIFNNCNNGCRKLNSRSCKKVLLVYFLIDHLDFMSPLSRQTLTTNKTYCMGNNKPLFYVLRSTYDASVDEILMLPTDSSKFYISGHLSDVESP